MHLVIGCLLCALAVVFGKHFPGLPTWSWVLVGISGIVLIAIELPFSVSVAEPQPDSDLDARMLAAGMMPVSKMLESSALNKFFAHAGVTDLESFEQWIQMQRKEFISMQARMTLDGKEEEDDLYEWVVAHNAVLGAVMANFRQATGRKP